jgi:DNA-binding GntR family transcriptional regulator
MADRSDATIRDGQNVTFVHNRLREGILAGEIPPGEVSQAALARQLDVGRTPLREAVRMLQREGLVYSEPNRRIRIAELSASDAEELLVMRVALECAAIRLTVPTLGSTGIAEIEGLMAQMDHYIRSSDPGGYRGPHHAFHARLVTAGGERMTTMIAQLFDHAERYQATFGVASPKVWGERRAEHRAIVDAVVTGDPDLAALRLALHYGYAASMVFDGLGGGYAPDRLRAVLSTVAPGSEQSLGA